MEILGLTWKDIDLNRGIITLDILNTRYIPVPSWNKDHEWPPIGGLRNLIFYKEKNGFAKVVKRVGKRVLIDEAAFFEWVKNQGGK